MFINKATKKEEEVYTPKHSFADFQLSKLLLDNIKAMGITTPSPIQDQAIPFVLEGKDVIGIASTGTGKTAAFTIPLIVQLLKDPRDKVMVMCPTRELAEQVEQAFRKLSKGMNLFSFPIVGGASMHRQISELRQGLNFVVGTPGRIKDLIERQYIVMKDFKFVVLDEADRMLDMGFVHDMRTILGMMPPDKQSLFFSATFSPEIKKLCGDFLRDPITVAIKSRDTSSSVEQDVIYYATPAEKLEKLCDILNRKDVTKVIIFKEMKSRTERLARELVARGYKARAIHGDLSNAQRKRALADLTTGAAQIVVATDVAARGIDIKDVSHVINYNLPNDYDTYVHRIGRTGRADKTGTAYTFVEKH